MSQSAIAVFACTDEACSGLPRNCTFMASSPIWFGHDLFPKTGFHFALTRPFGSGSCPHLFLQPAVGRIGIIDHDLADQLGRHPLGQRRITIELPMRIVARE